MNRTIKKESTKAIQNLNNNTNSTIDKNRKHIDHLKDTLSRKMSALNAIKSKKHQSDDSKVLIFLKFKLI